MIGFWIVMGVVALLVAVTAYDLLQKRHAILRNFPILGHFRYLLEMVGPELRQYIVTDDNEERPFSRDERRWVYASAKRQNNYFGFGTDNDLETSPSYLILKHAAMPLPEPTRGPGTAPDHRIPCAKVLGGPRGRAKAFRMPSVINVSAMSFGSLGPRAVEALNRGCALDGCLHNTGEGGLSPYHAHGGELIWQIGTGYFGCRTPDGEFDMDCLRERVARFPVRAIEIKLSQGAKPGHGGVLPAAKITPEIAEIRGIPLGKDCISPPHHRAFHDVDGLLDFVERIADATGLPVGIKSAVGQVEFWSELAEAMIGGERGVDFITVDGGEGGTGAAPLVFADHVALPFKLGMARVYREFVKRSVDQRIVFLGSGKLGYPQAALFAFALGCDGVNVAREAMLSIGCIQARRCHTDHCPTGVATQNRWLNRGLDPISKSQRHAQYLKVLRKDILQLCHALGVRHPAEVTADQLELLDGQFGSRSVLDTFGYEPAWGRPSAQDLDAIRRIMDGEEVAA